MMVQDRQLLLTPGPLCTHQDVRAAMQKDWGSWDEDFKQLTEKVVQSLLDLTEASDEYVCVLLQGSGTFAVEASIQSLIREDMPFLVLSNGAYGKRMVQIAERLKKKVYHYEVAENEPITPQVLEKALRQYPDTQIIGVIHCETSTGIINPVEELSPVIKQLGLKWIIDAMCSFGALPLPAKTLGATAIVASANKCLEAAPGVGFVFIHRETLTQTGDISSSLSLSLYDQWQYFKQHRQWRFTPPTHLVAALAKALEIHQQEGGQPERLARYRYYSEYIYHGMTQLGFKRYLPDQYQGPMIQTFHAFNHPDYDFKDFYQAMKRRHIILYPGKLTHAETFRMGNMGQLKQGDIDYILLSVQQSLIELNYRRNE